jgi:hypothetical protein
MAERDENMLWVVRADAHGLEWWYVGHGKWSMDFYEAARYPVAPITVVALLNRCDHPNLTDIRMGMMVRSSKDWSPRSKFRPYRILELAELGMEEDDYVGQMDGILSFAGIE